MWILQFVQFSEGNRQQIGHRKLQKCTINGIIVQFSCGFDLINLCDNNVDKMKRNDEFQFLGEWQFWTFSCGYDFADIGTER